MPMTRRRILLWGYIVIACLLLRGYFFYRHVHAPLQIDQARTFDVESGATFNRVVSRLANAGIVAYPFDVRLYGRLSGKADAIRAGEYLLSPGMTPGQLLDKLVRGDVVIHQLVIVEGWTLAQALAAIQANPAIESTLAPGDRDALRSLLGTDAYPEGQVFPDTYNFTRGTRDRDILLRARDLLQDILAQEWAGRDVGLPYESPGQALIMASIVEKETALASEREQIAGVFVRRLQRGMRLQTDPTVIYGLGNDYTGDLSRADLQRRTPYNTYMNAGLPPTPIALAGRESIYASLHPDDSDTLYFVAKGDGSHYFSATLQEHEQAVQRYQLGNGQQ